MDDDFDIDNMLEEKMQENFEKKDKDESNNKTDESKEKEKEKDKDKDREKKHKKHKHHKHKSHKSEKKHDRKRSRSRSPHERRRRSPTPPVLPSGKKRDVNSELHQLAQTLNRNRQAKETGSSSKSGRREKSPELTPEERDLRTVFCMQLAGAIRPRDLEDFFTRVGKVRDVRLITDPRTRRSKGVAYVEFRDLACVQAALALSGEKLLGIPIIIKPSNAEKNRLAAQAASATASQNALINNGMAALTGSVIPTQGPMKLYVGSLHFNITEDMLRGIFEPFGRIDNITLMRDADTNRSRGYGFIQFAHAEDAKRAMENLNGFELAGRPMKVGHVTESANTTAAASGSYSSYAPGITSSFSASANLDSDDLDHRGINLGPTGRLALMAKLSEGSGLQMPKHAMDALQAAHMHASGSQAARVPEPPNPQQLATVTAVSTQCFMLSNMFNPAAEAGNPNWVQEIRDEVIEECNKYGGVVHIYVDEKSPDGNVYVKCSTIASAINTVNALHGRFFSGRTVVGNYIPTQSYHKLFPASASATALLKTSFE